MHARSPVPLSAPLLGMCALLSAGCVADSAPEPGDEALILLLADGPLTAHPAADRPPVQLGATETIVNHALVDAIPIQTGLLLRPVHSDSATGRSISIVSWPADSVLLRHWHPVTERLWMLSGTISSPDGEVREGMFWEARAQVAMGPFSSTGSLFVFLGEGPFVTHYLTEGHDAPRAGRTTAVAPDTLSWDSLAGQVSGSTARGALTRLSAGNDTDRAVYLVRMPGGPLPGIATYGANLEGYVLRGEVRLSDPYHGIHVLRPGFYFRIPRGFPSSLFGG